MKKARWIILLAFFVFVATASGCGDNGSDDPDGDQETASEDDSSEDADSDWPPFIDGDQTDGDQTDGDQTDGDQTDGDQTDGDQTDGDQTDGDQTDGDQTDGDQIDGDGIDGDQPDGDLIDGDGIDGDQPDGDLIDGDGIDGDVVDGDYVDGDTDDEEPGITECRQLDGGQSGEVCTVEQGNDVLLIRGNLLTPTGVLVGGDLLISAGGTILCVDCDCTDEAEADGATVITCPEGVVSPGLINAHDHMTFTQNSPGSWGTERYEQRHDWRKGKRGHTKISVPGYANGREMAWGELRQVLSGTTSIAGSGGASGFLRNLDSVSNQEQLNQDMVDYSTFPLGDSDGTQLTDSCNYPDVEQPGEVLDVDCYLPHVAEGIDAVARNEFLCVSDPQYGVDLTEANSAYIHAVGLRAIDGQELATNGTSVVWSPRTNVSLYGNTAPVTMFDAQGVLIGLGTDWTASGSVNMLRELQCASFLNNNYYNHYFSYRELWLMATRNSAMALAVDDAIGELRVGLVADIAIYNGIGFENYYEAVVEAEIQNVTLVLRAGWPISGDTNIMALIPNGQTGCEAVPGDVCSVSKTVCALRETGYTYSALAAENTESYGLFFCGVPTNEPSCVPFRNGESVVGMRYTGVITDTDRDGDGIADAEDNCPDIFNPIRPLDNDIQADHDQDGVGDVCDVCPMDADTSNCSVPNPNDRDGDGYENSEDNCPSDYNPGQEDDDNDEIGNLCDACPNVYNPNNTPCPASIYDIKHGDLDVGTRVEITGIVTAVSGGKFFVQTPEADYDATYGAQYSAVYVYIPAYLEENFTLPVIGDLVVVGATINNYYGQIQLDSVESLVISDNNQTLPEPVVVAAADVATDGSQAAALEAVLLTVEDGEITLLNPPAGSGDQDPTNEFVLESSLRVNDFFFLADPFPEIGDVLTVTGVLRYANGDSKLEPRDTNDIVYVTTAPPVLETFGPSPVYIDEGETDAVTIPELVITLNRPAPEGGTVVDLESDTPSVLSVDSSITVAAGERTATVLVTGVLGSQTPATITASLGDDTLDAEVVVISPTRVPKPVGLSPDPVAILVDGVAEVTVTLDIPARSGGTTCDILVTDTQIVTAPADVTVPEGEFSAMFDMTAQGEGETDFSVSTLAGEVTADIVVSDTPALGLILSEVYYDHPSTDDSYEWIEIYNGSGQAQDLSGYSIGNGGTDYTYLVVQLSGTIENGECFVIGGPLANDDNGNPTYDQSINFDPDLQNSGDTADGVALFNVPANQVTAATVPIDAVIYGTTNTNNLLDESGSAGNVDVGDASATSSISRTSTGWEILSSPTPNDCSALMR